MPKSSINKGVLLGKLTPEETFALIDANANLILGGEAYTINTGSLRYVVFRRSLVCAACGITGIFFRLEFSKGNNPYRPNYNLYAVNETGDLVLMTKDHIIPLSYGGPDALWNLQTMCEFCNLAKSDTMPSQLPEIPEPDRTKIINKMFSPGSVHNENFKYLEFALKFPEVRTHIQTIFDAHGFQLIEKGII